MAIAGCYKVNIKIQKVIGRRGMIQGQVTQEIVRIARAVQGCFQEN